MRDMRLLLLLLSGALVATWIYHVYDKMQYSNRLVEKVPVRDSAAIADAIRDSLQQIYAASLAELDSTKGNADALHSQLDSRVNEISRLRKEVTGILQNRKASREDLSIARQKINEMRTIIAGMRQQNSGLEEEKNRLHTTLDQLQNEMTGLKENIEKLDSENKRLAETVNMASTFIASDVNFRIVDKKQASREKETTHAAKADKIVFSFYVQNNIASNPSAEVYIVVTDPIGQVIQNPVWSSGHFSSKQYGTKAFSIKERFDYNKGEKKQVIYTMEPARFMSGTYILEVYHNGVMIANASKKLD